MKAESEMREDDKQKETPQWAQEEEKG